MPGDCFWCQAKLPSNVNLTVFWKINQNISCIPSHPHPIHWQMELEMTWHGSLGTPCLHVWMVLWRGTRDWACDGAWTTNRRDTPIPQHLKALTTQNTDYYLGKLHKQMWSDALAKGHQDKLKDMLIYLNNQKRPALSIHWLMPIHIFVIEHDKPFLRAKPQSHLQDCKHAKTICFNVLVSLLNSTRCSLSELHLEIIEQLMVYCHLHILKSSSQSASHDFIGFCWCLKYPAT